MPSSTIATDSGLFAIFTDRFESLGLRYMVTGSIASMLYGEPRLTHDVDVVLALRDDAEVDRLCAAFPDEQFYCAPAEVVKIELRRRHRGHFNIIDHDSGFKADVYLAGEDALHRWALAHCRPMNVGVHVVQVAPPEYVMLRKLEYFREGGSEKHLRDVRAMLRVLGDTVDRTHLDRWMKSLQLLDVWQRVEEEEESDAEG